MRIVNVKVVNLSPSLPLPKYETQGAAGFDLMACFDDPTNPDLKITDEIVIKPGVRALIPTGLIVALPDGYELQIRPRSGLALKKGITVLNTPGTVDADYRGKISIILINNGTEDFIIHHEDKIAQGVINEVPQCKWEVCESKEELPPTDRGEGGFGHTTK